MSEFKECPKCGMMMEEQKSIGIEQSVEEPLALYPKTSNNPVVVYTARGSKGMDIAPFLCPRCGYVELYKKTRKGRKKP